MKFGFGKADALAKADAMAIVLRRQAHSGQIGFFFEAGLPALPRFRFQPFQAVLLVAFEPHCLLKKAASLAGLSVSQFVMNAAKP